MKKFLLFGLIAAVLPAVAEEAADRKTATSLKYVTHELDTRQDKFTAEANKAMEYTNSAGTVQKRAVTSELGTSTTDTSLPMVGGVNTKLDTKQDDIDPVNDHTAVTYTGQPGGIGQKGIYQATGTYAEQSDNLIDAKTFNAAVKNGLDSEFKCREDNRAPGTDLCWLYTIHNKNIGNNLPDDYTELEWIESTGTQYINTHIIPNATDIVEVKYSNITRHNGSSLLFGVYAPNPGKFAVNFHTSDSTRIVLYYGNYVSSFTGPSTDDGLSHIIKLGNGQLLIDGSKIINGISSDFALSAPVYIFNSSVASFPISARAHYAKIINNNGVLLFNGIPARHGATVGMYDTVSQQFFPSAASGTNFVAGPELNVYIPQGQQ